MIANYWHLGNIDCLAYGNHLKQILVIKDKYEHISWGISSTGLTAT